MAIFKQFITRRYRWGIWKMEETLGDLLEILPYRGVAFKDQLNKFTSDSRKKEWLTVRVLLYKMLGDGKTISYLPSGKPVLEGNQGYISISHTKDYVAVIYSKDYFVGIDIERLGDRILRVAHKFVTDEDYPYQEKKIKDLTLIWSMKEVMYKCMDVPGVDFRENFHVALKDTSVNCDHSVTTYETYTPHRQAFEIQYMVQSDEFVMSWTAF